MAALPVDYSQLSEVVYYTDDDNVSMSSEVLTTFAMSFLNSSSHQRHTPELLPPHHHQYRPPHHPPSPVTYDALRPYVNGLIIPAVLAFGAVGNSLSLAMLATRAGCAVCPPFGRRRQGSGTSRLQPLERAAVVGLAALALSDLLFCLVGIPAALMSAVAGANGGSFSGGSSSSAFVNGGVILNGSDGANGGASGTPGDGLVSTLVFYYKLYRSPLHNLFLVTSTWLAVAIAMERFIAVGSPLRARWYLKARYSAFAALVIFIFAGCLSAPLFFRYTIIIFNCTSSATSAAATSSGSSSSSSANSPSTTGSTSTSTRTSVSTSSGSCRVAHPSRLFQDVQFRTVYHIIWSTFGMIVPLILLLVASCGLVVVLYRSRTQGITSPERYPCTRVTATVTAIVITYLVLVCPSAVLETVRLLHGVVILHGSGDIFLTSILVLNLGQAVWFGANFLLYCGCAVGRRMRLTRKATGPHTYQFQLRGFTSSKVTTAV